MAKTRMKKLTRKEKKYTFTYLERYHHLQKYLETAGLKIDPDILYKYIAYSTAAIAVLTSFYMIYSTYFKLGYSITYTLVLAFVMLTFGYALIYLFSWLFFLSYLDYKQYKRKTAIEAVLPEFYRLVASNHRTGLSLDKSLWKSNKPRFGILSKEITEVAKSMYTRGDLIKALKLFALKYDSKILKRSINNLAEGIKGGADVATLLDNIAEDITEIHTIRKDLAADVQHYTLFTIIAALIIAPFMYGVAFNLMQVVYSIKTNLIPTMETNMSMFSGLFKETKGTVDFFSTFAVLMLITNSVMSCLMTSTIKYGNYRQEVLKIPFYILLSLILFKLFKFLVSYILPQIG